MLTETKNTINKVIAELKVGNSLFPDHIYLHDPHADSEFKGITDLIPDYVFLKQAPFDETFIDDQFTPTNQWAKSIWVLVGRSTTYPSNEMLGFCVNRIGRVGGCNVINITDDSERIYVEETGHEPAGIMNLIRITFTVSTIVTWCNKTFELCQNGDC